MKNRLETQAKPAYFHWIFAFHTVAQHPYASPVVCSKLSVIVCIKSWPLLKNKRQLQLFFIIKFMNKNGVHIKAMDCCCVRTVVVLYKVMATVDSCYVKERSVKLRNHYEKAWILRTAGYKPAQLLHPEFTTPRIFNEKHIPKLHYL